MATLNIRNTTGAAVTIADTGILMPASTTVAFTNPKTLRELAGSASLITLINAGTLAVVDGGVDMAAATARVFLKSFTIRAGLDDFPQKRLPEGYIEQANVLWASVSAVTIGSVGLTSSMRDHDDTFDIILTGQVTVDITATGANGLDTGAEAANTWYAVHAIGDSRGNNPTAGLLSVSATAPTLPSGYDTFRRVGWVRNNGSSDFFKFVQSGTARIRKYNWQESKVNFAVLSGGSATTRATVSFASFVPPTARIVEVGTEFLNASGADGDGFGLVTAGELAGVPDFNWPVNYQGGLVFTDENRIPSINVMTDTSQAIEYAVSQAVDTLDIHIIAFWDEL